MQALTTHVLGRSYLPAHEANPQPRLGCQVPAAVHIPCIPPSSDHDLLACWEKPPHPPCFPFIVGIPKLLWLYSQLGPKSCWATLPNPPPNCPYSSLGPIPHLPDPPD